MAKAPKKAAAAKAAPILLNGIVADPDDFATDPDLYQLHGPKTKKAKVP
jgi:hypothetical protein